MPGPYYGKDAFFALVTEVTNGTFVDPTTAQYNGFKACSLSMQSERTSGNRNMGRNFERDVRLHRKRVEGDITMDLAYQGYDHVQRHLFGAGSDSIGSYSGSDTGAKSHVFLATGVDEVGASITVNAGGARMKYPGCKIVKGVYRFGRNDPLQLTVSVVGQAMTSTPGSALSPVGLTFLDAVGGGTTIPTVNPVEPSASSGQAFRMYVGTSPATQSTSVSDYAEVGMYEGQLELDVPHDSDRAPIGRPTITNPLISGFPVMTVRGSFKKDMIDNTFITAFVTGGFVAIKMEYVSGILIIPGGTKPYSQTFEMKFCQVAESPPQVNDPGAVQDDITFNAYNLDGVTSPLKMTIENRLATNTQ